MNWAISALITVCATALLGYVLVLRPLAKLEICRTYYPEISTISCFVSPYGLPSKGGK